MLSTPRIDPILFRTFVPYVGEIQIRWYAILYVTALVAAYLFVIRTVRRGRLPYRLEQAEMALMATFAGMILGARLFYVLFYNLSYYLINPGEILAVWKGGFAFHGGVLGGMIGIALYCRRRNLDALAMTDLLALVLPFGLALGRIGNFINGELWGTVTELPWGVIVPGAGPLPRHPSQLYQAVFEGPVLWLGLIMVASQKPRAGVVTAVFLGLYGVLRFFLEFFREPDPQLGYILGPLSMGHLLSVGLCALAGVLGLFVARRNPLLL